MKRIWMLWRSCRAAQSKSLTIGLLECRLCAAIGADRKDRDHPSGAGDMHHRRRQTFSCPLLRRELVPRLSEGSLLVDSAVAVVQDRLLPGRPRR